MGIVYHAFDWWPTRDDLAGIRPVIAAAGAEDAGLLRTLGLTAWARSSKTRERLAAFGLEGRDYIEGWLAADIVHPALVTLLTLVPSLQPTTRAAAIATGAEARSALTGETASGGFVRFPATVAGWSGPTVFDGRALPVELGLWRREKGPSSGAPARAPRIGDHWRISTAIW